MAMHWERQQEETTMALSEARLEQFVHKALGDLGSALTASLVVIGRAHV